MITVEKLLDIKFKHLKINVIERDDQNNVLVFSATYVKTKRPDQFMSDGQMEINKTLWNRDSRKRPKGYWVLGGTEKSGVAVSYLVSEEWLDQTPKEIRLEKEQEWIG